MAPHSRQDEEAFRLAREALRQGWIDEKAALEQERARLVSSDYQNEETQGEIERLDQKIAHHTAEIEALRASAAPVSRRRRDPLR